MRISDWSSDVCSSDLEDVFGDPSVDVIVICSPSQHHAAQVIAACRAGVKAILCEKPFAMTAEEANEIAAVSEERSEERRVGKSVTVRVDLGGRRNITKKQRTTSE